MEQEFNPEEQEDNVYSGEAREGFVESGEISAEEEAFMQGYEEAESEDEKEDEEE